MDPLRRDHRYTDLQIGAALQWYFDGLSYRETARKVAREFGLKPPDGTTVYGWIQGY